MLKPILGEEYFKKFAAIKPRAFDSYVQQYGRLVDGQDKIIMGAQYSGYIEFKAKGRTVGIRLPGDRRSGRVRRPTASLPTAPTPTPPQLFMDWFLSPVGQQALSEACCSIRREPTFRAPPAACR